MTFFTQNSPIIQSFDVPKSWLDGSIAVHSPQMRSYAGIYMTICGNIYMPAYGIKGKKYICPHMAIYIYMPV